jgi:hypothetical protein
MESFIFTLEADVHYLIKVEADSEKVKKAVLRATDSNNVWLEYDIPGMGKICTLSGKEMYDQCENVFEALEEFKHTTIEETSGTQGYDVEDSDSEPDLVDSDCLDSDAEPEENDSDSDEEDSEPGVDYRHPRRGPDHPKQPFNAYLFFCQEKRREVATANPNMRNIDIVSLLANMWKELGDKAKYQTMADEDKKRYDEEMIAYEDKKSFGAGKSATFKA